MSSLVSAIDRAWYPGYGRHWDDALFRQRVLAELRPDSIILDLGAGAGIIPEMRFRGLAARVCGVDLDSRVLDNPLLDEAWVADAGQVPYADGYFDLVLCNNVLEHLAEPARAFAEAARVLRPGGAFLFKTPNKWHYVATISRLTGHGFHRYVNRRRGRAARDTFPTLYRANTAPAIARLAAGAGLQVESLEHIEGRPEYLRLAWPAYVLGAAYERLVNATTLLAPFRVLFIGRLRKPA